MPEPACGSFVENRTIDNLTAFAGPVNPQVKEKRTFSGAFASHIRPLTHICLPAEDLSFTGS
jgi:hypothetical protein